MAGFLLRIQTRTSENGPLFDNRSTRAFNDFAEELEEQAAEWALDHIKSTFHMHFQQPTGYYESNVRIRNTGTGTEVWDGGQGGPVYGPWLEGVGSRNNTTRFKGYGAFRKAASALDRRIAGMGGMLFRTEYRRRLE